MFYHISGELVLVESNTAVVDCNGVGYSLTVSLNTQRYLKSPGQKIKLYTHFSVREDGVELFGFYDLEERDIFKLLITVSGVGPKAAINIMSALTPQSFVSAVMNGDTKLISKAQNVGAKTAARIVLELKDKLAKTVSVSDSEDVISSVNTSNNSEKIVEAQNALMVLGYKHSEAVAALRGIDVGKMELEDIIREALKRLMR
ncbi:MAG: Holliday junction branch migration protein RuvA [Clostridia bacterium]|nr:Holliday junction branch migration protein RuvA [Clostridia bacterium]